MPRQSRLDFSGALHHIMGRGIERRAIFAGDEDRDDFLARLETLVKKESLFVYAWALMPNHFHLLVRTTKTPLSHAMRKLMSGYAGYFNRHHRRVGHVFQNRFKSILCEEETYFLELVRYIHLNPVRAGLVKSMDGLGRSSHGTFCSYGEICSAMARQGRSVKAVLWGKWKGRVGVSRVCRGRDK